MPLDIKWAPKARQNTNVVDPVTKLNFNGLKLVPLVFLPRIFGNKAKAVSSKMQIAKSYFEIGTSSNNPRRTNPRRIK